GQCASTILRFVVLVCSADTRYFIAPPQTTRLTPLSLHDALPISLNANAGSPMSLTEETQESAALATGSKTRARAADSCVSSVREDRKSTRLNSSHGSISYAVCCLKKINKMNIERRTPHLGTRRET